MRSHGDYDNMNFPERNKSEIVLTKKLSLLVAPVDQNALQFSKNAIWSIERIDRYLYFHITGNTITL